ncbi:hypothetical protein JTB14_028676 [Gonioctena quinquepunctata]|nr:hypothetical protein JTB14_028676 [Gonioctena quinquepunctata]
MSARTLDFKLKPTPKGLDPLVWVKNSIKDVVSKITQGIESTDQIGFTFCSKELSRGEGWIKFRPASKVTFEDVWNMISSVYQSNSSGLDTETFCLSATTVKMPKGKSRASNYNSFDIECSQRKAIVVIKNKDNLCPARSLVVAKAYIDNDPDNRKVRDFVVVQTCRTLEFLENSGIEILKEGGGISELEKFQDYVSDYTITVYKYGNKGRDVLYEGVGGTKKMNLLHHENHFNVIISLTAAFCLVISAIAVTHRIIIRKNIGVRRHVLLVNNLHHVLLRRKYCVIYVIGVSGSRMF